MTKQNEKHAGGRPSKYTPELLAKAKDYAENWPDYGDPVPMLCAMYIECGISRDTASKYQQDPDKQEFADVCARIMEAQERVLIGKGISRVHEPSITKLMLMRHGYNERSEVDHSSKDGSMSPTGATQTELDEAKAEILAELRGKSD